MLAVNTTMSTFNPYHLLNDAMKEHDCVLLTTEDEMRSICRETKKGYAKVRYIASCGHPHQVYSHVFIGRLTGVKCPTCKKKEYAIMAKTNARCEDGQSTKMKQEDDGIEYIKTVLAPHYTVRKTVEGCLADCVIQPKEASDDAWLRIQVKTTQKPLRDYGFNCSSRYRNCIILCLCMSDKKMWLLNGNNITVSCKIAIGLKKSKYDQHEVTTDTIASKLLEYYRDTSLATWEDSNTPISPYQQAERHFRAFVESKCPFLPFEYTEKGNMVYDFTIHGLKVQEKIGSIYKNKAMFTLHKNNGKTNKIRKFQPYKLGDNDFYWLNFPDKRYFLVLPEHVLVLHGFIANGLQPGKKHISINAKKIPNSKFGQEYLFDYNNFDIPRLTSLFSPSP